MSITLKECKWHSFSHKSNLFFSLILRSLHLLHPLRRLLEGSEGRSDVKETSSILLISWFKVMLFNLCQKKKKRLPLYLISKSNNNTRPKAGGMKPSPYGICRKNNCEELAWNGSERSVDGDQWWLLITSGHEACVIYLTKSDCRVPSLFYFKLRLGWSTSHDVS